jgi:hypothetical protein
MRRKKSLYHRVTGDISSYITPTVNSSTASGQARKVRVGPSSSQDERSLTSSGTTSGNVYGVTREIFTSVDYEIPEEGDNEVEEFNNDNIVGEEEYEQEVSGDDDRNTQKVKRVKSPPSTSISPRAGDYEPSRQTARTIAL